MKIIYCHHALREMGNPPGKEDGLTELGIKDANIMGDILDDAKNFFNVKAIYTSPFYRCKKTAQIINKHLNAPIIEDERLNEYGSVYYGEENETWKQCQERILQLIKDIVYKYDENDTVVCVTSGVNITAFICAQYKMKPSDDLPLPIVLSCSPIGFRITKENFLIGE